MPEQLKVKPSVDCHHPASVISASTIPAARCGPAVEGPIPRRPDDKIGVAAAYGRVGDNARGFDSDIGSFGNFFYPVRRMETRSTERIVISRASHFRANETLSTSEV